MRLIIACLLTAVCGLALTYVVRGAARARGIVARPREDRWHQQPTALLGGVAIYLAFLAGLLIYYPSLPNGARLTLLGASLIFALGLLDDFYNLKPPVKLVTQLAVAAVVVYFGRRLPWTGSEAVNIFITIFWLVGITNAINLLDNMDGLAGGISAIACLFLALTFVLNGQTGEALLPALLGGALVGFLVFNFNPASIFMGDCGSLFLGFSLGGMSLLSEYDRTRHLGTVLATPVLIMLIPIFDTSIVTVMRKISGRKISQGGRDHTSHRLVALGVTERRAVMILYLLAVSAGALAMLVRGQALAVMIALLAVFAIILLFLGLYLAKAHVYKQGQEPRNHPIIETLVDFSYKRRVFEIFLDAVHVALAYYCAYLLRFGGEIPEPQLIIFLRTLPLLIAVQMVFLLLGGVYRGLWRYAGLRDLIVIARAVLIGVGLSGALVFALNGWRGPSKAVFILDALLLMFFMGASRLSFRVLRLLIVGPVEIHPQARRVLIYGAGDGGELLLREILNNSDYRYLPVGFVDDDATKVGKVIHGYRIFRVDDLPDLVARLAVNEVIISSAKVPENRLDQMRELGLDLGRMRILIESEPASV